MPGELPVSTFFTYSARVPRRKPGLKVDGTMAKWGPENLLPDIGRIDGKPNFADIYMSWDPGGIYIGIHVKDKSKVLIDKKWAAKADAMGIWIDTRDVRDAHRASRFCHAFVALPRSSNRGKDANKPMLVQTGVPRAREQAPNCDPKDIKIACRIGKKQYSMEIALTARALNGFDPSECSRLGFFYVMCDHEHGRMSWPVPLNLPGRQDPSLWAALELQDVG